MSLGRLSDRTRLCAKLPMAFEAPDMLRWLKILLVAI